MTTKRLSKEDELTAAIARVDAIEARIADRSDRISTIEGQQYRAAAAGDEHDPQAFTTKLALVDQQVTDAKLLDEARRIVAGIEEDIHRDQLVAELAQLRLDLEDATAAADAAQSAYEPLLDEVLAGYRAGPERLIAAKADVRQTNTRELNIRVAIAAVAEKVGEPAAAFTVADRVEELGRDAVHRGELALYNAEDPRKLAAELAAVAFQPRASTPVQTAADIAAEASQRQVAMDAARRKAAGLPTYLEEQQQAQYARARADREERIARWGAEQMQETP